MPTVTTDPPAHHEDADALLLTLENVVPYLLEHGLLDPEQVVHGELEVQNRSRRNRNFKVIVPEGRRLLVKQPKSLNSANNRDTVQAEAFALRAAATDAAFRDARWFCPRFYHHDEDNLVLVTELVHPATTVTKYHLNGGDIRFPRDSSATSARILAAFHDAGARARAAGGLSGLRRTYPAVWNLGGGGGGRQAPSAADLEFGRLVRERVDFLDRIPALRRQWDAADAVVHGDVRWDNLLLTHGDAPADNLNMRLIDWEMVTLGDPLWDVACYLAEHLRFWLLTAMMRRAANLEDAAAKAAFPLEASHDACRHFWETYHGARGATAQEVEAAESRLLDYLPFTALLLGVEFLQNRSQMPGVSRAAVEMAAQAAADAPAAARRWFGLALEAMGVTA